MSAQAEPKVKEYKLDSLKWVAVAALVIAIGVGNTVFGDYSFFYRMIAILAIGALAVFIATQTQKGAGTWELLKGARGEMRRVTWPTRQEANQQTLIVVVFVFLMAILLWLLDLGVGALASQILG